MTKLPYLASGASLWRGYDYYSAHKVLSWEAAEATREEEYRAETWQYVRGLKKAELQEELYRALLEIDDLRNRRGGW